MACSETTAYIGIGSNLEDKRHNCLTAVERVEQIPGSALTGRSDWYLTRPVGVKGQDWYVNGVVSISTKIPPRDLLGRLLAIESDMGRVRRKRWESRIIDLDILLYGHEIIKEEDLTVPHPLMHLRKFVLVPLVQLAPDLIHPSLGVTIAELLRRMTNNGQEVIPLEDR
ncbi:MAG: 2-amino-4-hydroxy-6-hydroxymethyldihydropteridine diphosphokinase [Deltaproteobacteria bacterium]|nr:MAG: 2-amino-4-hydroxy-6-hydroxymethyldihydropteridine diphosphokinase [Deltaproteobacteria bacterium]